MRSVPQDIYSAFHFLWVEAFVARRSVIGHNNFFYFSAFLCTPNNPGYGLFFIIGNNNRRNFHIYYRMRWGWDSNPRCRCRHNCFQDNLLQPLRHPTLKGRRGRDSNPQALWGASLANSWNNRYPTSPDESCYIIF